MAQEPVVSPIETPIVQEALEQQAENVEEEFDYTDLLSELEHLVYNPIKINIATFDQMKQLFFLNDIQITNLLEYRNMYGEILTLYELAYIDGIDRQVISMLEPFITLSKEGIAPKSTPMQVLKYGRSQLFLRYQQSLETRKGFLPIDDSLLAINPNQRFLGSPYRFYTRYAFNYRNRIRWGITAEKDPGEEFFKGSQKKGFDFYSAFFYMKGDRWLRDIVVGDYHLQFGQGLTFWTTPSFGKSVDVSTARKISRGVKPSTSSNEVQFLRGSAATLGYKRFTITAFGSHRKVDATIRVTDTLTNDIMAVSALQTTGLHRTPNELTNSSSIGETIYGGRTQLTGTYFQVGATYYRLEYSTELKPSTQLYSQFSFRGRTNNVAGSDFLFIFRKGQIFGEISRSASGGTGLLTGIAVAPSTRLTFSAIYRRFDKNFHSYYSAPFAESSFGSGEEGLYLGTLFLVSPKITFRGYTDFFRFNWLRYRVDAPSRGREHLGEVNYRISRQAELNIRYRYKQRAGNQTSNDHITLLLPNEKQNIRLHFQYQAFRTITLRNRAEWAWNTINGNSKRQGYMMYQDVIWKPSQQWSISARYALFDTDTYDERIYAYENDVLYAYSVPAYYYKGSRTYLLLRWQASRNLDFWFKASQSWFANTTIIGSGLDEITGNTKSEVKLQLRYKF
ncbi:MAG: helix-hairpin-helix domain-containing protein [Bacteroidales bacterium]|nr:helix-hairpin-helix domain-containing protein [Bacteroidales bacterium]